MSSQLKITYGDETVTMEWNGAEASAPIVVDGEKTPYQTADARHRTDLAVALACRFTWPGLDWPRVPSSGSISSDWPEQSTEAWDAMSYEKP